MRVDEISIGDNPPDEINVWPDQSYIRWLTDPVNGEANHENNEGEST
jgi:hypothetical protein